MRRTSHPDGAGGTPKVCLDGRQNPLYLVLLDSILHRKHRVRAMSAGLAADQADESFIIFTEDLQRFLVPLTSFLLFDCFSSGCLETQPLGYFQHSSQFSAGSKVSLLGSFLTLRTGERSCGPFPTPGDTCSTKIVTTVDGDRILEIFQADRTRSFTGER